VSALAPYVSAVVRRRQSAVPVLTAARLASIALCFAFVLTIGLSLAATPRRTGDAHQYIAMALQLSQLRLPSLSPQEEARYRDWLAAHPVASGFPDGADAVRQPSLFRDNRQEFSHFWGYPLLVAPLMAAASVTGAHPLAAFAITNAALLAAALWAVVHVFGPIPALLLLASPLIWFVGRAQVEVFTVSLLCLALAAAARGRWEWASLAVAAAATQNLPIAAVLPLFWAGGLADWILQQWAANRPLTPDRSRLIRALAFGIASVGLAFLHPLYYLARLGVVTPQQLNGGITSALTSRAQFLAPLTDPDIGFLWWLPVTTPLTVFGGFLLARSWRTGDLALRRLALVALCAALTGLWFLVIFAQTTNVNSGGTVHISRYALWLLPLTLPMLTVATRVLKRWRPSLPLPLAVALFAAYLGYFQPDQPERYVEHSPQAAWLMSTIPAAYHPLPEIFVERTLHIDGGPRLSAADPACRLLLLVASAPDQTCPLAESERAAVAARFASGDVTVWIRRADDGTSAVTTALAAS
jgi:hypothetical protein